MKPPHIKAQRQKEFRKIRKRQKELYTAKFNLGLIPLDKPLRYGWYKELKLTVEVEKYKNAEAIIEVHHVMRTEFWGKTKEKAQEEWDKYRAQFMLTKDKPTISKRSFRRLSEKARALCVIFRYKCKHTGKYKKRFYVNIPSGCTTIKFTRAYITHRKIIDPAIESELDLLDNKLLSKGLYEEKERNFSNKKWNKKYAAFERKIESRANRQLLNRFIKEQHTAIKN